MRTCVVGFLFAVTACKAELAGSGDANPSTIDAPAAEVDAPMVDAAVALGPWSTPMPVPGASAPGSSEDDAVLGPTGLEMIFAIGEADGTKHLYRMTRPSLAEAWSMPERLAINVTGASDQTPRLSPDGRTLYFASNRAGGIGGIDVYSATRQNPNEPFSNVALVPNVNDTGTDRWFTPCATGDRFVMLSQRPGDDDEDVFEGVGGMAPTRVPISSANNERGVGITPDCLTMYFGSDQTGTFQLYTTTRSAPDQPWPEETPFTDFSAAGPEQEDPWISLDQRTFLFTVTTMGNKDVYIATR